VSYSSSIVADLAVIMIVAAIVVYLFHRLKQPIIVGYLIAGIIIGPYTPPFSLVSQTEVFSALADLGVILLLFDIGLEFPLSRLRKVGKVSIGVAAIEIAIMMLLSFGVAELLGWSLIEALFLGTALASSSTAIIAKVLSDMGKIKETSASIMLGILVVEDLIVVMLLSLITVASHNGSLNFAMISIQLGKILAFLIGSILLGIFVISKITNRMVQMGNNEVVILVVLGFVFGLSIIASLLGFSVAIGAFLMGVIMAGTRCVDCIITLISPVKDMFAAIFFVSVGALIDITQFPSFWMPALLITVLMVFGKTLGCGLGTRLFGYDNSTSIKVGLGMSQIGEFAFIVMKAGQDLGLISTFLFSIVGVSAGITTFLTPYLIKLSYRLRVKRRKKSR